VLFTSVFDSHLDPTYSNANAFLHHIESKPSRVEIESSRNRVESKPNRNPVRVATESEPSRVVSCLYTAWDMTAVWQWL
jgi:hypothetical protein